MHLKLNQGPAKHILKWDQNLMIVFVIKKAATMVGGKKKFIL